MYQIQYIVKKKNLLVLCVTETYEWRKLTNILINLLNKKNTVAIIITKNREDILYYRDIRDQLQISLSPKFRYNINIKEIKLENGDTKLIEKEGSVINNYDIENGLTNKDVDDMIKELGRVKYMPYLTDFNKN